MTEQSGVLEAPLAETSKVSSQGNNCAQQNKPNGKSRRMRLLERMGCFTFKPNGIRIERAASLEEFLTAYQLVHDIYVEEKYILPKPSGLRLRVFEAIPHMATFIAKTDGKIVGVSSVVIDSEDYGLPSDNVFTEEIQQLRDAGRKVCEGTNWAVLPKYRRTPVMTELLRCGFTHALENGCDDCFLTVSPGHKSFFELMAFETISTERNASTEIVDPVVMVNLPITEAVASVKHLDINDDDDLALLKGYYLDKNPYRDLVKQWDKDAPQAFRDPRLLYELFVNQSNFLQTCGKEIHKKIKQLWGETIYHNVKDLYLIEKKKRAVPAA